MNGTDRLKLLGTLALGVALALAGAGCVGAPESGYDAESVSVAAQQLKPIDSEEASDEPLDSDDAGDSGAGDPIGDAPDDDSADGGDEPGGTRHRERIPRRRRLAVDATACGNA